MKNKLKNEKQTEKYPCNRQADARANRGHRTCETGTTQQQNTTSKPKNYNGYLIFEQ